MLTEEQLKKIISANESLQVQLAEANRVLEAREEEIELLSEALTESTALRSVLDGKLAEIESIQDQLGEKQKAVKGAEERELELQQELTGMALLNRQYNELVQDYAYLQSQFKDIRAQHTDLLLRYHELEKVAGTVGELQSRLENSLLERNVLKEKIDLLEAKYFLKEI